MRSLIEVVAFGLAVFVILLQADNNKTLIYDLNVSQAQVMIQASVVHRVTEENVGLRQANECLITYSYRDRCITAIKHTPLPRLLKEVR